MVEILFDNGIFKSFSIEPFYFEELLNAMRDDKTYYSLSTTDGFFVRLALRKIVSVIYKKEG